MKKIILSIIIAISVYSMVSDTNAIQYQGSNSYYLPNMNFSTGGTPWNISPKEGLLRQGLWFYEIPNGRVFEGLSCFRYPEVYENNGYLLSAGWYTGDFSSMVEYTIGVSDSGASIFDSSTVHGNAISRDTYVQDFNLHIVDIPNNVDNGGVGDDAYVICIHPFFTNDLGGILEYEGVNVVVYGNSGDVILTKYADRFGMRMRGIQDQQDWSWSFMGYLPDNGYRYDSGPQLDYSESGSLRTYGVTPQFSNVYYQPYTPNIQRAFIYGQDFGNDDQFGFNPTLSGFFGASGTGEVDTVWWGEDNGGGGTGTGTNYFEDCTSFLDVGCFIQGLYNAVLGKLDSLFPDIEWTGGYSACPIDEGIATPIGYDGGNTYLQAFADFLAIINPIPIPEDTEFCLIGGREIWDDLILYSVNGIVPMEYERAWNTTHHLEGTDINIFDLFAMIIAGLGITKLFTHNPKTDD